MHSLSVNQTRTSIVTLDNFLKSVGNKEKLRAKRLPTGEILLYTSLKDEGTGLKNRLFKTVDKRRLLAVETIKAISQNSKAYDAVEVFSSHISRTGGGKEFNTRIAKQLVHSATQKSTLPDGVECNEAGDLLGSCIIESGPTKGKNIQALEEFDGKSIAAYIQHDNSKLKKFQVVDLGTGDEPIQKITHEADTSFIRGEYEIPQDDGSIFNSYNLKEKEVERKKPIARALRNFAGTPAATTVLSRVLHQSIPSSFFRYLRTADGQAMDFLRMISSLNTQKRAIFITGADGMIRKIENLRGLGAVKYKLTRRDGNFVLSFDWTSYYEVENGYEDIFPLEKNHAIRINYRAEILIDEQKAHEGNLVINMPDPVVATFSGRLKRDAKSDKKSPAAMQDNDSIVSHLATKNLESIKLRFNEEAVSSTIFSNFENSAARKEGDDSPLLHRKFPISKALMTENEAYGFGLSVKNAVSQYITTQVDIKKNPAFADFPLDPDDAFDIFRNLNRTISKRADKEVRAFFQEAPSLSDDDLKVAAIKLSKSMTEDLKLLEWGGKLLTDEKFIKEMPLKAQEALRELGQCLNALRQWLIEPEGPYSCLARQTGLAMNSPGEFRQTLEKYKKLNNLERGNASFPSNEDSRSEAS